jgi:K(+)-stimulated pyrophosphate-energized sodium pump
MELMKGLSPFEEGAVLTVLAIALIGIAYAFILRAQILKLDTGTPRMQEIWGFVKNGASAYLKRQFRTISILSAVLALVLAASVLIVPPTPEAQAVLGENAVMVVAIGRAVALLVGALFAYGVGYLGMHIAVEANVRVAAVARKGYNPALLAAYRAGSVTGLLTVGLGLLGATVIFILFGIAAPDALVGFGLGASVVALFLRVGGGLYTKAADIGAAMVSKQDSSLSLDNPNNAAVIADLVGDNAGDSAGMAADMFESFEVTLIAAMILGLALGDFVSGAFLDGQYDLRFVIFPLLLRAIGVVASIIGGLLVRTDERRRNAMASMNRGFYAAAILSVAGAAGLSAYYMIDPVSQGIDWRPFSAVAVGVVLALVLAKISEYFTSTNHRPVKDVSSAAKDGAAANLLSGLANGMESSAWAAIVIALSIVGALVIYNGVGAASGLASEQAELFQFISTLYGVSLTGIGMLMLAGNIVAMDGFGPVADNAYGIGVMAGIDKNARNVMEDLDAVGNTTKAITKGLAIGSAVLAAVALFGAYLADTANVQQQLIDAGNTGIRVLSGLNIASPAVFIGLLIGSALPFLFSSLNIRAVQRSASAVANEVRSQHGSLLPDEQPNYAQVVAVSTGATQQELLPLGLLVIVLPLLVGFAFGVEALGSFLIGALVAGQLLAVFQVNSGSAWDNAKKFIEEGNNGGKYSDAHNAALISDTVGDALKDAAGPALNPMIKVINLIALVLAPIVVVLRSDSQPFSISVIAISVVCLLGSFWAIWHGKRK